MEPLLHCRDIERDSGKIEVEQLRQRQRCEYGDALEVGTASGANVGPAKEALPRTVQIGELLVARLTAAGAAQSSKRPRRQTSCAAEHALLLCPSGRRASTAQLGQHGRR